MFLYWEKYFFYLFLREIQLDKAFINHTSSCYCNFCLIVFHLCNCVFTQHTCAAKYNMNFYKEGMVFPGGSVVNNILPVQETWVWSLGQKGPLKKEMAIHSSTPAWEIPWTEELGGLQSMGSQKSWTWFSN